MQHTKRLSYRGGPTCPSRTGATQENLKVNPEIHGKSTADIIGLVIKMPRNIYVVLRIASGNG
jgi:hypothetical protein